MLITMYIRVCRDVDLDSLTREKKSKNQVNYVRNG